MPDRAGRSLSGAKPSIIYQLDPRPEGPKVWGGTDTFQDGENITIRGSGPVKRGGLTAGLK